MENELPTYHRYGNTPPSNEGRGLGRVPYYLHLLVLAVKEQILRKDEYKDYWGCF